MSDYDSEPLPEPEPAPVEEENSCVEGSILGGILGGGAAAAA